ncbi:MAG: sortase, partial [Patescibacteria group bacterium]|nr:sortase [Patescibacteria group bacterium]
MPKQKKHKNQEKKITSVTKSSVKKPRKKKQLVNRAKLYFIIGFSLLSLWGLWKLNQMTKYSFAYQPHATASKQGLPTFVAIKDSNIFLPIRETLIENGIWQVADDGASHLATSNRPGENGTIIIYGHNTLAEFGSLPFMWKGERIVISTADGKTYTYTVTQTGVVDPTDVDILKNQSGETLIIYTCYGFADLQRFVII